MTKTGLVVLVAVLVVAFFVAPAVVIGRIAKDRGRRFWPWFFAGLWNWPAAVIVVFAVDDLVQRAARECQREEQFARWAESLRAFVIQRTGPPRS